MSGCCNKKIYRRDPTPESRAAAADPVLDAYNAMEEARRRCIRNLLSDQPRARNKASDWLTETERNYNELVEKDRQILQLPEQSYRDWLRAD